MSHNMVFSIIGAHIKNSGDEVEAMLNVSSLKKDDFDYDINDEEVFNNNIYHGTLALYSINAALESIVAFLNRELKLEKDNFYNRIEELQSRGIITDEESLDLCKDLRKKRNILTHWEEDEEKLMHASGYILFMFGNKVATNKKEELISILNKESMRLYLESFNKLLNSVIKSEFIKGENDLSWHLEHARGGGIQLGY